ncbi:MAG: ethanolamine ammonia-lyase reactivating factor EutA [Oscillospiraceae bacterium]|nr:ethanolamine ammonia-lyase reactivating factor EutA [Oscillospiraceae bacterium]
MSERLLSVGLDVGTTSTQLVVSRLLIENKAGSFAVPELEIEQREILYRSPVHFTPLLRDELVDASALRQIVDAEYAAAGITKEAVDTGAIIITGETSRKENAEAVLGELSDYAGDFVVATAGPDLESVLAAKGAGAAAFSAQTGKCVLHMDIGGGTSNLALIEDGKITATTCLNVGGRLLKISPEGVLTYVSPVLKNLFHKHQGEVVSREEVYLLCEKLVQALEAAAGLREEDGLTATLHTAGSSALLPPAGAIISFSGGVADCIEGEKPWLAFGDMGPELGRAIKKSRLCRGEYRLGSETIRATVIGAGSHSTQLSGSTVFFQNVDFPLKNLPVVHRLEEQEEPAVLALKGMKNPGYAALLQLAEEILGQFRGGLLVLALEQDMAKALGQCLALRLGKDAGILCIDRVSLEAGSFLDVGAPVGPALPVVVKTLILNR